MKRIFCALALGALSLPAAFAEESWPEPEVEPTVQPSDPDLRPLPEPPPTPRDDAIDIPEPNPVYPDPESEHFGF